MTPVVPEISEWQVVKLCTVLDTVNLIDFVLSPANRPQFLTVTVPESLDLNMMEGAVARSSAAANVQFTKVGDPFWVCTILSAPDAVITKRQFNIFWELLLNLKAATSVPVPVYAPSNIQNSNV